MDFILLFILFIDCENLNMKIQYAANNPGVNLGIAIDVLHVCYFGANLKGSILSQNKMAYVYWQPLNRTMELHHHTN